MKRILLVFACMVVCAFAHGASSEKIVWLTVSGNYYEGMRFLAGPSYSDDYVGTEDTTSPPPPMNGSSLEAYFVVGSTKLMKDSHKLSRDMTWTAKIVNSSGATKKGVVISWDDASETTFADEGGWTLTAKLDNGTPVDMLTKSSLTADITAGTHTLVIHAVGDETVGNNPPVASISTSGLTAKEGSVFTCVINATDADGDALQFKNYQLDGKSLAGTVTSLDNNQWRFTSTNALAYDLVVHPSTSRKVVFSVDVTDGKATVQAKGNVTVQDTNRDPVASFTTSGLIAEEGKAFSCVINASDADGDDLQIQNVKLDGKSLAGTTESLDDNQLRFTSTDVIPNDFVVKPATSRTVTFSAVVSDGKKSVSVSGNVTVQDYNSAPVASISTSGLVAKEGSAFSIVIGATDADGDILQIQNFMLDGKAIAGSVSDIGGNRWRFTSTNPLDYDFVVHPATSRTVVFSADVTDGKKSVQAKGNVAVQDVNRAPAGTGTVKISPASPKTTQSVKATASGMTDADGDTVTYEFTWKTGGVNVVAATLPAEETVKGQVWTLTTVAKDGFGGEVSLPEKTVTIANSSPTLASKTVILHPNAEGDATVELDMSEAVSDADGIEDIVSIEVDGSATQPLPAGGTLSLVPQTGVGKFLVEMDSEGGVQSFPEGMTFQMKATDASGEVATATVTVISQANTTPWYPVFQMEGVNQECKAVLTSSKGETLTLFQDGHGIYPNDYYATGFAGFLPGAVVDLAVYAYDAESGETGALLLTDRKEVENYGKPEKPTLTIAAGENANSFQFTVDAPVASCMIIELRDRATDELVLRQKRVFAPGEDGMIPTEESFLFQVAAPGDYTVVVVGENPDGIGLASDGDELDCSTGTKLPLSWPADAVFDNGGSQLVADAFAMTHPVFFRWPSVPGATGYELHLNCKELMMEHTLFLDDGEVFARADLRLSKGEATTYEWCVVAIRGEEFVIGPVQSFRIVRFQENRAVDHVSRVGNRLKVTFTNVGAFPAKAEVLLFDEDALTSRWRTFVGDNALAVQAEGDDWSTGLTLRADHSYHVQIRLIQEDGEKGEFQQFSLP